MKKHRIIIAGSRTITDYHFLAKYMDDYIEMEDLDPHGIEIVSGTARGVDQMGEQWAAFHQFPVIRFPAKWKTYGRSAGHRRNAAMAEYATHLVAFWDGKSRGTKSMIALGLKHHLNVDVVSC